MLQNIQHFQDVNDTFYVCFSVNADYVKIYVKKMASKKIKILKTQIYVYILVNCITLL